MSGHSQHLACRLTHMNLMEFLDRRPTREVRGVSTVGLNIHVLRKCWLASLLANRIPGLTDRRVIASFGRLRTYGDMGNGQLSTLTRTGAMILISEGYPRGRSGRTARHHETGSKLSGVTDICQCPPARQLMNWHPVTYIENLAIGFSSI
jgi:hypothetical protein